jgi:hypothetical protein
VTTIPHAANKKIFTGFLRLSILWGFIRSIYVLLTLTSLSSVQCHLGHDPGNKMLNSLMIVVLIVYIETL